jgi:glutathione S-transferase
MVRFVELEEARAASGLRLVVTAGVPSPWSEGAKGCFDVKRVDYLAVRLAPRDAAVRAWTGHDNAPVALYGDEPPRAGWAEILALAERLAPRPALLPHEAQARVETLGVAHEILGENGLIWCARLLLIHAGLTTEGERGFSPNAARYLAGKYGYAPDRVGGARARVSSVIALLAGRLGGGPTFGADGPNAVDIYAAVAVGVFHPLPEHLCPMLPAIRHAYETTDAELRAAIPPALLAHRDLMYERHLTLPVRL